MSRKLILLIILIMLGTAGGWVYLNGRNDQPANGAVESAYEEACVVSLAVDGGDGAARSFSDLDIKNSTTALELLTKIAAEDGFSLEVQHSSIGDFISAIGEKTGDSAHFWSFFVNGEMATVGAGEYQLKNGDAVEFKWTEMK